MKQFQENNEEESVESMEGKHSPISSPVMDGRDSSVEHKDAALDEFAPEQETSAMEKEEMNNETQNEEDLLHEKKQSLSQVEQTEPQELDDEDDSKAARSSENSKARSGSSRDFKRLRDSVEEEVMQDGRSARTMPKKQIEEGQRFRRKDREGRQEMERNRMVVRGREGSYPRRDLDPSLPHPSHMKNEGFDRRKERENSGIWQRREEEYSRKSRPEDSKKRDREHGDEIASRNRGRARESERIDKDEPVHSRKQLDNGSYRVYDKDGGSRHRERDDNMKNRFEMVDDYYSKRRKEDEYVRDHADRDEILHAHRDPVNRRKRERDEMFDQRKRDDQQRIRESYDDHHPGRHKEEVWLQRERGERPREREREEWHRLKSHEEPPPKREREEGRGAVRSGRSSEDKAWIGHPRTKDDHNKISDKDYQTKDIVRHSEPLKRRERVEDDSFSYSSRGREDAYSRGNQITTEERKLRQERSVSRNDRAVHTSDSTRMHEKKHKEASRKNREPEGGDYISSGASKRNQEDQGGHTSEMVCSIDTRA